MNHWIPEEGLPYPLGAVWNNDLQGFNFALYSKTATTLSLNFFDKDAPQSVVKTFLFDPVKNKTGTIWHCFIKQTDIVPANAYRVDGPADPGNHFDAAKLLLDPWAKAVFFPPTFSRQAAVQPGDNIGKAALSLLIKERTNPSQFETDSGPRHYHDLIIYEMHVRGFTFHPSSGVLDAHRGTFAGIIDKIPYLQELGVTAVELMPVHQFDPQENNYWGYMTLNFFSPHHKYGSTADSWELVKEFKSMVQALHRAGIEVILDVIYNHTVEGSELGPMYSYKGIDNSSYYLLTANLKHYVDDAGTGNVMRTSYKMVRKLILDSLRYWVEEMHVDGFRFDLATIFTRNDDASVNLTNPPILEEISMDPVLANVRLIAEPWDLKQYQLGNKFPGASWAQWNGDYRDVLRRFVKGNAGEVASVMSRIYGSADLFPDSSPHNNKPYQSINFIDSHDGYCLHDLLAYNSDESWNCGWEGEKDVPADVLALRRKQAKNFVTLLFFSNGIPMFRMGDEFLNTQQGNTNPYNQDNLISWLNWDRKNQFNDIFRFFKLIIACRKAHPSLCRGNYWRSNVEWFGVNRQTDMSFNSHTLAYFINGASLNDADFYVLINAYWEPLTFTLQKGGNNEWKQIINTALDSPEDVVDFASAQPVSSQTITLSKRSIIVLQRKPTI